MVVALCSLPNLIILRNSGIFSPCTSALISLLSFALSLATSRLKRSVLRITFGSWQSLASAVLCYSLVHHENFVHEGLLCCGNEFFKILMFFSYAIICSSQVTRKYFKHYVNMMRKCISSLKHYPRRIFGQILVCHNFVEWLVNMRMLLQVNGSFFYSGFFVTFLSPFTIITARNY
jgi:hypothetical protein